ncbi:hypothetical protein BYT27DRAFT_7260399 [Phlegmacium glaucopus]|nr:hypothetical protein BYT27DRAFT_7260399 [Phlegmacium glaucopus]
MPTTSSFMEASSGSPPSSGLGSGLPYPPLEEPPIAANFSSMEVMSPTLSTSSTDEMSMDSTPLQTPTHDDDEGGEVLEKGLGDGEEESQNLRWSLSIEHGHFATTIVPSPPTAAPTAASVPTLSSTPTPILIQGGVEMGTSPPFSDLEGSVRAGIGRGGGGSVHWDWGYAAGALGGGSLDESSSASIIVVRWSSSINNKEVGVRLLVTVGAIPRSKSGSKLPAPSSGSPPSIPSSSSPLFSSSSTPIATSPPASTPSPIPPKKKRYLQN